MEAWKIIFLSKWVICRFQPFIFQGVPTHFFRGEKKMDQKKPAALLWRSKPLRKPKKLSYRLPAFLTEKRGSVFFQHFGNLQQKSVWVFLDVCFSHWNSWIQGERFQISFFLNSIASFGVRKMAKKIIRETYTLLKADKNSNGNVDGVFGGKLAKLTLGGFLGRKFLRLPTWLLDKIDGLDWFSTEKKWGTWNLGSEKRLYIFIESSFLRNVPPSLLVWWHHIYGIQKPP